MPDIKKFTLRNEYFGGVVHDSEQVSWDVLEKETFETLIRLINQKENGQRVRVESLPGGKLREISEKLLRKGAIDSEFRPVNTRVLIHPINLPEHALASPLRVYDTFGYGCNLECPRCLNKSQKQRLDEGRRTIEDTKKIIRKFYDAGTMEWRITGGEPTFYGEELLEAIATARSLGMSIMLNTNACWEEKMYSHLLEAGIHEIIVSIEGPKEVNDSLRAPGVYDHIMRTLGAIDSYNKGLERKIRVTLNMTVGKKNADSVEYVVRMAAKRGYTVNFVPTRPFGRATKEDMLTTREFMEFSRGVQRLREDPEIRDSGIMIIHKNSDLFNKDMPDKSGLPFPFNYSTCSALATGFGLCPDGRANACNFLSYMNEFVGMDLTKVGITVYDAWLDPKMDRIRKAQRTGCTDCSYHMKQCEGKCFAMAYASGGRIENGKIYGNDSDCFRYLMPDRGRKQNET